MNENSIFTTEETIISKAELILKEERNQNSPLFRQFSGLLKSYKKIFKQLKRLIKLSDKQQARLNELNKTLENENYQLVMELGQSFESFVRALSTAVDAKHPLTAGHSHRVTEYSLYIGESLGLSEDDLEVVKYASLLHDIGKIGVPDAVLTKKGRFTPEEREMMNEHSVWTYRIIKDINLPEAFKEVPSIASHHHEKLDGSGYPYKLKGKKIHFFSRLIAVSDVFDALTSRRDYPKYDGERTTGFDPMSMDAAFNILEKGSGTHFDPEVVTMVVNKRNSLEELWSALYSDKATKIAVEKHRRFGYQTW